MWVWLGLKMGIWRGGGLLGVGVRVKREGVYAPVGPTFLAHTKQKVSNIVDLTVLRLAFFMAYELHKVVQWFLY